MRFVIVYLFFCLFFCTTAFAQHYSLYNTGTMYDAFENPSQKSFQIDSSKRYSFNFFIPTAGVNYAIGGPADAALRKVLYTGIYDTRSVSLDADKPNYAVLSENSYLLAFRMLKTVKYQREMGFSWQIKTEGRGTTTNRALIVMNNYNRIVDELLNKGELDNNIFNTTISAQSYHQFSFTYRENYNKRLAWGLKLSYLSGMMYNRIKLNSSTLQFSDDGTGYDVVLNGNYKTSFYYDDFDYKSLRPGFKNPGAALGLSVNYRTASGWYIMGNLKDMGFIKWNKKSYEFRADDYKIKASRADDSLWNDIKDKLQRQGYLSATNSKAEGLMSKDFGAYSAALILSKNLLNKGGDAALVNTIKYRALQVSLPLTYNLDYGFQAGGQLMIKSPNVEFFLGSDQSLKTSTSVKSFSTSDETLGKGYSGASVYFGFALKFGPVMNRWQNSTLVPGINDKPARKTLMTRLFGHRADY
ncbi:DUF5723 family protein [Arcticibacter sp. MXS-1]|uniref:DUF5723 family protein n=1 Tax=Arcticibacter sp. MXS-1 TaxID=3341726 RepID=UPI0035A92BA2